MPNGMATVQQLTNRQMNFLYNRQQTENWRHTSQPKKDLIFAQRTLKKKKNRIKK